MAYQRDNCGKCGLPYEGENLVVDSAGKRRCKECLRESWRKASARYRAVLASGKNNEEE